MKEVTINRNDANQRLDKFLTKYMPELPQGMLYKGLRKNFVRVNGKHIKDGRFIISEGDVLSLYFADEFFTSRMGNNEGRSDIDVLYEDENIILINKKAGIVVHSDDKGTSDTLLSRMQSYLVKKGEYKPEEEHSFAPSFCNRLDRNTSGIIIGAKNASSLRIMNEKIKTREVKKSYLAVAEGTMTGGGELSAYLSRGEKKVSVTDIETSGSKRVNLKYNVLAAKNNLSLVEIELGTGRTHQIRAQLSHIGHPLAGDTKYGAKTSGKIRLASYKLEFDFISDAGILNYLNGRIYSIHIPFGDEFGVC